MTAVAADVTAVADVCGHSWTFADTNLTDKKIPKGGFND